MTATNEQRREEDPASLRIVALSLVMGLLALVGVSGTVTVAVMLIIIWKQWNLTTAIMLALNLVVGAIGVWGLLKLKPWKLGGEPVSSATRRTNRLFAWSGVLSVPAPVLLIYASRGEPSGLFSNSAVAPGIAIAVIAFWLVAVALAWGWYASTDEHDRKAYDFGSLVGGGVFFTVTPVWWVAARAGLLPQPDAMVLWLAGTIVMQLGWFWRRYR